MDGRRSSGVGQAMGERCGSPFRVQSTEAELAWPRSVRCGRPKACREAGSNTSTGQVLPLRPRRSALSESSVTRGEVAMGGGNVDHQETVRPFVRAAEYLEARPPIKPSKVSPFEGVCKKRHPGAGQNCPHGNHVGSLHDCRVGNSGTP